MQVPYSWIKELVDISWSPEELAKRANNKLRLAKILLKRGQKSDAKRRFEQIVEEYPGTKAAEEARQLLDGL